MLALWRSTIGGGWVGADRWRCGMIAGGIDYANTPPQAQQEAMHVELGM